MNENVSEVFPVSVHRRLSVGHKEESTLQLYSNAQRTPGERIEVSQTIIEKISLLFIVLEFHLKTSY